MTVIPIYFQGAEEERGRKMRGRERGRRRKLLQCLWLGIFWAFYLLEPEPKWDPFPKFPRNLFSYHILLVFYRKVKVFRKLRFTNCSPSACSCRWEVTLGVDFHVYFGCILSKKLWNDGNFCKAHKSPQTVEWEFLPHCPYLTLRFTIRFITSSAGHKAWKIQKKKSQILSILSLTSDLKWFEIMSLLLGVGCQGQLDSRWLIATLE